MAVVIPATQKTSHRGSQIGIARLECGVELGEKKVSSLTMRRIPSSGLQGGELGTSQCTAGSCASSATGNCSAGSRRPFLPAVQTSVSTLMLSAASAALRLDPLTLAPGRFGTESVYVPLDCEMLAE